MNEYLLIILAAALEAFLHYFPWRRLLRGRELPRLIAYTLGMLALMVPFSLWLIKLGQMHILVMLWKIILAGGITVTALYGLDHYLDLMWHDREVTEREAEYVKK
jgi:hypothetical protein